VLEIDGMQSSIIPDHGLGRQDQTFHDPFLEGSTMGISIEFFACE
jgi:hypothetical protein